MRLIHDSLTPEPYPPSLLSTSASEPASEISCGPSGSDSAELYPVRGCRWAVEGAGVEGKTTRGGTGSRALRMDKRKCGRLSRESRTRGGSVDAKAYVRAG